MNEPWMVERIAAKATRFAIGAYKRIVSPWLPPACRFVPTCSEYADAAVAQHGVVRGLPKALGRLLRCHPFSPGGVDLP